MTEAAAFLTYDGSIATITLNRPERFNAMDEAAAVTLALLAREECEPMETGAGSGAEFNDRSRSK